MANAGNTTGSVDDESDARSGAGAGFGVQGGFSEVCVSVAELTPVESALVEVCGYSASRVPAIEPARFPGAPAGCLEIEQSVLTAEGDSRGHIRLIRFRGCSGVPMRGGARSWDTGGLFDIGCFVRNVDDTWQALLARGWQATGVPVAYEWGGFSVRHALVTGPGGILLSLMQPKTLPLASFPAYKHLSRAFNCAQVVRDYGVALDFFRRVLGWQVMLDTEVTGVAEPGREVLGLPMPWALGVLRRIGIVHPQGQNDGSMEIVAFEGVQGRDCAPLCVAPNLGMLSTRFHVRGLADFRAAVLGRGGQATAIAPLSMAPFGDALAFSIASPDGAQFDFYENA
jgi:hypothetical protein